VWKFASIIALGVVCLAGSLVFFYAAPQGLIVRILGKGFHVARAAMACGAALL